jgi:hypothetical protein
MGQRKAPKLQKTCRMIETENLVLEHLSDIRGAVDVREDMCEVKERLGTLEANYASVSRRVDRISESCASKSASI